MIKHPIYNWHEVEIEFGAIPSNGDRKLIIDTIVAEICISDEEHPTDVENMIFEQAEEILRPKRYGQFWIREWGILWD